MSIDAKNGCRETEHTLKVARQPASAPEEGEFVWNEEDIAARNYKSLGKRLAASGGLFRRPGHGGGLLLLLPDGKHQAISKGADLAPVIVDRVPVRVEKGGKIRGSNIAAAHLNAMLRSRSFLDQFRSVDQITNIPLYLSDFSLTVPGYNDGGTGYRTFYTGGVPAVSDSLETIAQFLDVMEFASNADRRRNP